MRKAKGFTLVELVIVIVIVGILSIVAVPIYRGYTRKAMATEAKSLLGTIQTAEKVYFAEYTQYKAATATSFDSDLDVDARSNKYFTTFTITDDGGDNFTAYTEGNGAATGIGITVKAGKTAQPRWTETGLQD